VAAEWLAVATGTEDAPRGWKPMTHVNEGGLTPKEFAERFTEPEDDHSPLPADLAVADPKQVIRAQESAATLANRGTWADARKDTAASNGRAVWMPETHHEWAYQVHFSNLPERVQEGRWKVYAVVRLDKGDGGAKGAPAWTMGVYDAGKRASAAETSVLVRDAAATYRSYLIGTVDGNPDLYAWLAPSPDSAAKSVWVDCLVFVPVTTGGQ
jgi:hypothetical protein